MTLFFFKRISLNPWHEINDPDENDEKQKPQKGVLHDLSAEDEPGVEDVARHRLVSDVEKTCLK